MNCTHCGSQLTAGARFCMNCGATVETEFSSGSSQNSQFGQNSQYSQNQYGQNQFGQNNQYGQNQYGQNQYNQNQYGQYNMNQNDPYRGTWQNTEQVNPVQAVLLFFTNYLNFKGRSRRSEYWWVVLFNMIVTTVLGAITGDSSSFLSSLWALAVLVPTIALAVRRLHDIGKSGWYYLINLIPLVGQILLIVWFCQDSQPGPNMYGPNPKAPM